MKSVSIFPSCSSEKLSVFDIEEKIITILNSGAFPKLVIVNDEASKLIQSSIYIKYDEEKCLEHVNQIKILFPKFHNGVLITPSNDVIRHWELKLKKNFDVKKEKIDVQVNRGKSMNYAQMCLFMLTPIPKN